MGGISLDVGIRRAVVHHNRRTVLGVIEEVQLIRAGSHMHNILAVQRVLRHHAIDRLLNPQPVFIIHKLGVGVNASHPRKLPPVFPRVLPLAIVQRVAMLRKDSLTMLRSTSAHHNSYHSPFGSRN